MSPRVELAMKSANAPSGRSVDGNVFVSDQRVFLGNIEGLRMTASSRMNSNTDLNRIHETRGNFTVEEGEGDLLVNEKNIDRQVYAPDSKKNQRGGAYCYVNDKTSTCWSFIRFYLL